MGSNQPMKLPGVEMIGRATEQYSADKFQPPQPHPPQPAPDQHFKYYAGSSQAQGFERQDYRWQQQPQDPTQPAAFRAYPPSSATFNAYPYSAEQPRGYSAGHPPYENYAPSYPEPVAPPFTNPGAAYTREFDATSARINGNFIFRYLNY